MEIQINYLAVLVAGVAGWLLGAIWYSPVLFYNAWLDGLGKSSEEVQEGAGPLNYLATFIALLVMAYVMAYILDAFQARSIWVGLQGGFWTWLGLVATTSAVNSIFAGRRLKLYLVDSGYHLVTLLLMGMILAAWQ